MSNAWIVAGGNAEGFKFSPVIGEYAAQRVMGIEGDPAIAKGFRIPEKEYDPVPPPTPPTARVAHRPVRPAKVARPHEDLLVREIRTACRSLTGRGSDAEDYEVGA